MLGYHSAIGGAYTKVTFTATLLQILIHHQSYLTSVEPTFSSMVPHTS